MADLGFWKGWFCCPRTFWLRSCTCTRPATHACKTIKRGVSRNPRNPPGSATVFLGAYQGTLKIIYWTHLLSSTGFLSFSMSLCPSVRVVLYMSWYLSCRALCCASDSLHSPVLDGTSPEEQASLHTSIWRKNWREEGERGGWEEWVRRGWGVGEEGE